MWVSISTHNEVITWNLMKKTYEVLNLKVDSRICEVCEVPSRNMVCLVTFDKRIIFYNEKL